MERDFGWGKASHRGRLENTGQTAEMGQGVLCQLRGLPKGSASGETSLYGRTWIPLASPLFSCSGPGHQNPLARFCLGSYLI